jgi:hypothetical protein
MFVLDSIKKNVFGFDSHLLGQCIQGGYWNGLSVESIVEWYFLDCDNVSSFINESYSSPMKGGVF